VFRDLARELASDEVVLGIADGHTLSIRRLQLREAPPRRLSLRSLSTALIRHIASLEGAAAELLTMVPSAPGQRGLTADEEQLLDSGQEAGQRRAGVTGRDPVENAALEYGELVATSLGVTEAASRLRVNPSRVRQRVGSNPPNLYAFKFGKRWRIPTFQFDRAGPIPNLERAVRRLPRDLHPVAVARWFTTPSVDLVPDDETGAMLSPRDWLRGGYDPDAVGELAAGL
jgi:hypothetical protein